jgi:hypothetical protein
MNLVGPHVDESLSVGSDWLAISARKCTHTVGKRVRPGDIRKHLVLQRPQPSHGGAYTTIVGEAVDLDGENTLHMSVRLSEYLIPHLDQTFMLIAGPAAFFLHREEMSQAASWFLLVMFVALCAVVMKVVSRRSPGALPGTEFFSDGAEYMGNDTRPDPPALDIEDPDAPALSPDTAPDSPPTAPSMLAQRDALPDPAEEAEIDGQEMPDGIEPFVGDEYQPF